jgi:hypothetical protein
MSEQGVSAEKDAAVCNGLCVMGYEVLPGGQGVAIAHPDCDKHSHDHRPLAVLSVDGMPFVHCSCRDDLKPQSAVWLKEHWAGDTASGIQALRVVVAAQKRAAETRDLPPAVTRPTDATNGAGVGTEVGDE